MFRRALERKPSESQFRTALGLVLYQKGLYREARSYLEEALSKSPDNLRTQFDLQQIRETLKDIEARTS